MDAQGNNKASFSVTATPTMLTLRFHPQGNSVTTAISEPINLMARAILSVRLTVVFIAVEFEGRSNALDLPRGSSCVLDVCMHCSKDNHMRSGIVMP